VYEEQQFLAMTRTVLTPATIERAIRVIRGHRVILDEEIAQLYGVPTKRLNEQVKRNLGRFPADFMFQLTADEVRGLEALKSQIATASLAGRSMRSQSATASRRNVRYLPRAFTEQGVAMLASVLNSPRAIAANIEIVRVFVRLRQALAANAELAKRLAVVEAKLDQHRAETGGKLAEHERHIRLVFETIRQLMAEDGNQPAPSPRIGFDIT